MWINSDKQIVLSCSNPHVFYDRMRITKDVASTMWVISENLKQKTDSLTGLSDHFEWNWCWFFSK
jgi:hypothetical protein